MKKILIIFLLLFSVVSCGKKVEQEVGQNINTDFFSNSGASSTGTQDEEISDMSISGLEDDLDNFNKSYKLALFNSGQGNTGAIEQTKTLVEEWGNIISKYNGYEVKGFEKTNNLNEFLVGVGIDLLNASDYITGGNMIDAHTSLEKVREKISEVRQENSIKSISDDMLFVHNKMEEIVNDGEKKDIAKYEELKTLIIKLKDYNNDNDDYKTMLGDFENLVNKLSTLSGQEYNQELSKLKPLFIKMYMKFG